MFLVNLIVIFFFYGACQADTGLDEENVDSGRYTIEGRVFPLSDQTNSNWQTFTRVLVNGGEFLGYVRKDGSFVVQNLPSGSYMVEVFHPDYTFEPVRVEINSKGKFRARKVNHIQTALVLQVPYPLKIKALGRTRYFQAREQWRITDFLMNPMIMMMVLPLLLIMVLPKMMNDPETKKEMEQMQNLAKFNMPEMGDAVSNFLADATSSGAAAKKPQKAKKRVTAS